MTTIMAIIITSTKVESLAHLRLLQLLSPVLPVGTFSYSQGLEWAVHAQWVSDESEFHQWLVEWIDGPMAQQELPLLIRLYQSSQSEKLDEFAHWSQLVLATRDTQELRKEETDRANAYLRVLRGLCGDTVNLPVDSLELTPLASIAWASSSWKIPLSSLLLAYGHNWLENSVTNGVKLIPLGQTVGQQLIHNVSPNLIDAITHSESVLDDDIGFSMPSVSMASSAHETQYSRLYRS